MAKLTRVARRQSPVLLQGETGTGKEVMARAIHALGARAAKPFEIVDCGMLQPSLVQSQLFGHERGAFAGAESPHAGAFERANGGTLFLDDIGELPLALQANLIGALERRSFRRVGGEAQVEVDVRIICSSSKDLQEAVAEGTFRRDLYYRVAVSTLYVPPLRERAQDIPVLVEHFLRAGGHEGPVEAVISPEHMQALIGRRWPGNVRELGNYVESLLATGEAPDDEKGQEGSAADPNAIAFPSTPLAELFQRTYKDARRILLADFDKLYFEDALARANGNVSEASRLASLNRTYLVDILRKHGIRERSRPRP